MSIETRMKNLVIISFVLAGYSCFGQDNNTNTKDRGRQFQIGINFSPDICFRKLKSTDDSSTSKQIVNLRNNNETIKSGFTTGLNLCFSISEVFSLETGIQYSNKGYRSKMNDLIFAQPEPDGPYRYKSVYNFQYIDIPLKVNFTAGTKKIRFISSIGLTSNFFLKEKEVIILYYTSRTDKKTSQTRYDFNKVNISPAISAGIVYKINKRMNVRVEPTFRYGILKIKNSPVTGYLYNGGLNMACYYNLAN